MELVDFFKNNREIFFVISDLIKILSVIIQKIQFKKYYYYSSVEEFLDA